MIHVALLNFIFRSFTNKVIKAVKLKSIQIYILFRVFTRIFALQGHLALVVATGASACSFLSAFMASENPPSPSQWNPHPTLYRKPFYVVFVVSKTNLVAH